MKDLIRLAEEIRDSRYFYGKDQKVYDLATAVIPLLKALEQIAEKHHIYSELDYPENKVWIARQAGLWLKTGDGMEAKEGATQEEAILNCIDYVLQKQSAILKVLDKEAGKECQRMAIKILPFSCVQNWPGQSHRWCRHCWLRHLKAEAERQLVGGE
jgi:hypothetical protein